MPEEQPKRTAQDEVEIVETYDEKITEHRECKVCGVSKQFDKEHFKNSRFGLSDMCKDCYSRSLKTVFAAKKKLQGTKATLATAANKLKTKDAAESVQQTKEQETHSIEIILDMSEYPDLIKSIRKEASAQFRSIDNQILYLLHQHVMGTLTDGKDFIR